MNANALVKNQRDNFNSNITKPIAFRIGQLKLFLSTLKKNEALLCEAIHADYKKSAFDSFMLEFLTLYQDLEIAIRRLSRWASPKKVRTNLLNWPAKSYILPEPLGVALVIGAWNYPIQLSLAPVVGALAAGNTVVLKPSELCSATSRALERMINGTFAPNYFTVVEGEIPETTALLNAKFDKIFFTGSSSVGKIVYQAAAKNLTPVTLELGGKSPVIITRDSDLDIPVKRLIWNWTRSSRQSRNGRNHFPSICLQRISRPRKRSSAKSPSVGDALMMRSCTFPTTGFRSAASVKAVSGTTMARLASGRSPTTRAFWISPPGWNRTLNIIPALGLSESC
jgi:acyl-CoA reductase-like NAD-dependent aldehyde dehydrogenase